MYSLRKILVGAEISGDPLEFTPTTREAIDRALRLAQRSQSSITLMSVLDTPPVDSEALMESEENPLGPLERVQKLHADVSAQALERGVTVESRIDHGKVWSALIQEVIAARDDLLVVGSGQVTASAAGRFGSTAARLLGKCPCPVWVSRPNDFEKEPLTILAADDLGPVGEKVLHLAVTVAQLTGSRLLVVHAIADVPVDVAEDAAKTSQEDAEARIVERLSRTDYRTIEAGVRIEIGVGEAETVLKNAVQQHDAALLVMGTLERGGLAGFFVGNTAERLLPELTCSILGVKPDEFEQSAKLE